MAEVVALAPALQEAFRRSEDTSLTLDEYKRQLAAYEPLITCDFHREVTELYDAKVAEAVAKGLGVMSVDAKTAELEVLRRVEKSIESAMALILSLPQRIAQHPAAMVDEEAVAQQQIGDSRVLLQWVLRQFPVFPKARTAKIARELVDSIGRIKDSKDLQIEACEQVAQWCHAENRSFLKHRLQTKLATLHYDLGHYKAGLEMLPKILTEVKRADDKSLLVELFLLEARLAFAVRNLNRAKTALTAAKTTASAIQCPAQLQAMIDLVSGTLNMAEHDFRTSYSYFYEAFEAFHNLKDPNAATALSYMMLSQIMSNSALSGKHDLSKGITASLEYSNDVRIKCLNEIHDAYSGRSLSNFQTVIAKYHDTIEADDIIRRHIKEASEQLLEQAILKAVAPYSQVQISHIAKMTNLQDESVGQKLAEMVLDRKITGTIDQKEDVFIHFEPSPTKTIYQDSIDTFESLRETVQFLSTKVREML